MEEATNGVVKTEAGLIVPASAVAPPERKRVALPADTFKKMRRFIQLMHEEGIATLLVCEACKRPVEIALVDMPGDKQILKPAPTVEQMFAGRPVLRCVCSDRVPR